MNTQIPDDILNSGEILVARKMRELGEIAASHGVAFVAAMDSSVGLGMKYVRVGKDSKIGRMIIELAGHEADLESVAAAEES